MADTNTIITITNQNATVPQDTDYQFEFSITKPVQTSNITKSNTMQVSTVGSGKMFKYSVDIVEWQSINRIEVK